MPGPMPSTNPRRRNAPAIAGRTLPAEGRTDPIPEVPESYELSEAGAAWWKWAWRLPQATAWDDGSIYVVARRAQLEDVLAALKFEDHLDLGDLLAGADREAIRNIEWALQTLKRSASGMTGVMKEQRELDDRLGLSPKSMATLRWTIAARASLEEAPAGVSQIADYRARGRG